LIDHFNCFEKAQGKGMLYMGAPMVEISACLCYFGVFTQILQKFEAAG
jgi:hypothetical protein